MFSGSPVISPAVIGTYLMTCHGSLHMSAETEAERFVQAESPKFPFLLHKNAQEKRRVSVTRRFCAAEQG